MSSSPRDGKNLRVVFVGARDSGGGAARATYRIFDALWQRREELALDLSMRVMRKTTNHPGIFGGEPTRTLSQKIRTRLVKRWRRLVRRKKFFSPHTIYESRAEFDTGLGKELADLNADLYVLNWLGSNTLSIKEISSLQRKTVWQLHDMWAFSGAEHYRFDNRAADNYSSRSRPPEETGPDIHQRVFRRKTKLWRHPMPAIATTTWLRNEAKKSALSRSWPVFIQPYPLDTDFWHPLDRIESRNYWDFSDDELVVLFGAAGGTKYFHKGAHALFDALPFVGTALQERGVSSAITLAVFGEEGPDQLINGTRTRFLGKLDDEQLRYLYSSSEVIVVPSLLEAFGQVASEAHACGLPAVVFDNTGLTDIVADGETGLHAENGNAKDLAEKITILLTDPDLRRQFGSAARKRAVDLWNQDVVARRYAQILHDVAQRD